MLYIDLNKFKPINDTYGHDAGDFVLTEIAGRLQNKIADKGLVGRLGGDEFLIILDAHETEENVFSLCKEIKELAALPILYGDTTLHVGTSIGVSIYPQDGTDYLQLRKVADTKMYEDKGI